MPEIPAPVNKPIQIADSIIHAVEYDFAVKAIKAWARIRAPFLNSPVWGKVFDIFVNYFANRLYPVVSQFVAFRIVNIQVLAQRYEYETAKEEFRKAVEMGDADATRKAKEKFEAAFARGVHFDGM